MFVDDQGCGVPQGWRPSLERVGERDRRKVSAATHPKALCWKAWALESKVRFES